MQHNLIPHERSHKMDLECHHRPWEDNMDMIQQEEVCLRNSSLFLWFRFQDLWMQGSILRPFPGLQTTWSHPLQRGLQIAIQDICG